jgi:hypothetical protein
MTAGRRETVQREAVRAPRSCWPVCPSVSSSAVRPESNAKSKKRGGDGAECSSEHVHYAAVEGERLHLAVWQPGQARSSQVKPQQF